mmetsp:Transcript_6243/g.21436  ORF Transcript_6243/g.21436 Transcript_6243/m.21436 type:complete len:262 (-) Transcript_6243:1248-2033(-)
MRAHRMLSRSSKAQPSSRSSWDRGSPPTALAALSPWYGGLSACRWKLPFSQPWNRSADPASLMETLARSAHPVSSSPEYRSLMSDTNLPLHSAHLPQWGKPLTPPLGRRWSPKGTATSFVAARAGSEHRSSTNGGRSRTIPPSPCASFSACRKMMPSRWYSETRKRHASLRHWHARPSFRWEALRTSWIFRQSSWTRSSRSIRWSAITRRLSSREPRPAPGPAAAALVRVSSLSRPRTARAVTPESSTSSAATLTASKTPS